MAKKSSYDTDPDIVKKGFNYYCFNCKEAYRWGKLVAKKTGIFEMMVCPNCSKVITDLKRT